MKDREEKTQGHHRRTHQANDVPAGVPGPPRSHAIASTLARTHGVGARSADALHDADLVRYQDTRAIALRACAVTRPPYVHPFGPLSTDTGPGLRGSEAVGPGHEKRPGWCSGLRRCPLHHPGRSRTGTARLGAPGRRSSARRAPPGAGPACRGEGPLGRPSRRPGGTTGRRRALGLRTDPRAFRSVVRGAHPRHRSPCSPGHGSAPDSPVCSNRSGPDDHMRSPRAAPRVTLPLRGSRHA